MKVIAASAVLAIATAIGTAFTIYLYTTYWETAGSLFIVFVLAACHLLLCTAYFVLGESLIEDAVKSGFIASCGVECCIYFR